MIRTMSLVTAILVSSVYPIGLQHGTFRSQSTQGPTWTGTATIIKENMNISVHRQYLDIELEWVFKADGTAPAQYADALEIVGNLNLEHGSVVVGILVWYKDKLLKAKLQRKDRARAAYEEVVDRDSPVPPRPRDPVILEYLRNDNYDISIFPVVYQGTRRLRIRYLVPATNINGVIRAGFPHAFTSAGTVNIKKSNEVSGFSILTNSSESSTTVYSDSTTISNAQAYSYQAPIAILPKTETDTLAAAKTSMVVSTTNNLLLPGEFACVSNFAVSHILDSVKAYFSRLDSQNDSGSLKIYASIGNGSVACSTGVTITTNDILKMNSDITWGKPLYLYSQLPIKPEITWKVFFNNELFLTDIEVPAYHNPENPTVESKLYAASQKILSLEKTLPKSMAATFGFMDTAFAFLALEEDMLPDQLAVYYEKSGVPLSNEEDIFADTSDVVLIPATGLYEANFIYSATSTSAKNNHRAMTKNLFDFFKCRFTKNKLIITLDYAFYDGRSPFEIAIYSPNGVCLTKWHKSSIGNARSLEWSPRLHGVASGAVIVRVKMGSTVQAKTISLL